jgi:hypothetical protein
VLLHDQRANALALQVRVNRKRAEMDVRLVRVAPRPRRSPPDHPSRRSRPERDEAREQAEPLCRTRLTCSHRRDASHAHERAFPNRAQRLLSRESAEHVADRARVNTHTLLWIVAEGRHVERVVPEPPCEHTRGIIDLFRAEIAQPILPRGRMGANRGLTLSMQSSNSFAALGGAVALA